MNRPHHCVPTSSEIIKDSFPTRVWQAAGRAARRPHTPLEKGCVSAAAAHESLLRLILHTHYSQQQRRGEARITGSSEEARRAALDLRLQIKNHFVQICRVFCLVSSQCSLQINPVLGHFSFSRLSIEIINSR